MLQYMYGARDKISKEAQQEEALADDVYSQDPERGRGEARRASEPLFRLYRTS